MSSPPTATCDLVPAMRTLSEARHDALGSFSDFVWPDQRTTPFETAPQNGELLPDGFYADDYTADPADFYSDLQLVIDGYNFVKNFFVKQTVLEGATSIDLYTGADDYLPGVIDVATWPNIYTEVVSRIATNLARALVSSTTGSIQGKAVFATDSTCTAAKNCVSVNYNSIPISTIFTFSAGCIVASSGPLSSAGFPIGYSVSSVNNGSDFTAGAETMQGTISANVGGLRGTFSIYLKLGLPVAFCSSPTFGGPRPTSAAVNTFGVSSASITVNGDTLTSDITHPIIDLTPMSCPIGAECQGWEILDQAVILTRNPRRVAVTTCAGTTGDPTPEVIPPFTNLPTDGRTESAYEVIYSTVLSDAIVVDGACYSEPELVTELDEDPTALFGGTPIPGCGTEVCGPRALYEYTDAADPLVKVRAFQPLGFPPPVIAYKGNASHCFINPVQLEPPP